MSPLALRAEALRQLETLAESYPNLRLGQIISNALSGGDAFYASDETLLRCLNELYRTYSQFTAAGMKP